MLEIIIISLLVMNSILLILLLVGLKYVKKILREYRSTIYSVQVQNDMVLKVPNPVFHRDAFNQVIKDIYLGFLKNRNYEYICKNTDSGYSVSPKPGVTLIVPNPEDNKQLFDWFITEIFFGRISL